MQGVSHGGVEGKLSAQEVSAEEKLQGRCRCSSDAYQSDAVIFNR